LSWREATTKRVEGLTKQEDDIKLTKRVLLAKLDADNKGLNINPIMETKFGRIFVVIGSIPIGDFTDSPAGESAAKELLESAMQVNEGVDR
jgi:hypothetical protein